MRSKMKILAFREEMRNVSKEQLQKLGFSCSFNESPIYRERDGYAVFYVNDKFRLIPMKLLDNLEIPKRFTKPLF